MDQDDIELEKLFKVNTSKDTKEIMTMVNTLIYRDASFKTNINGHNLHFRNEFPGSHPVTLLKKDIKTLINNDYLVCEKSDGVRLLFIVMTVRKNKISFFLDRKNKLYSTNINFNYEKKECNKIYNSLSASISVFDGELYSEKTEKGNFLIFSLFDSIINEGESVMNEDLLKRLGIAKQFLSENRPNHKYVYIILKDMFKSYRFCDVYKNIPKLKHKNDGMIFTPIEDPYIPGRCRKLFKWKPSELNSVDFVMKKVEDSNYVYELMCYGKTDKLVRFATFVDWEGINLQEDENNKENGNKSVLDGNNSENDDTEKNLENRNEKISSKDSESICVKRIKIDKSGKTDFTCRYDGLVGEFCYSNETTTYDLSDFSIIQEGWKLHRVRIDKKTPNSFKVVLNVLLSIKEKILYEDLEPYYPKMLSCWNKRKEKKE